MIVRHDKPLPWKYHATPTSRGKRSALGATKRVNFMQCICKPKSHYSYSNSNVKLESQFLFLFLFFFLISKEKWKEKCRDNPSLRLQKLEQQSGHGVPLNSFDNVCLHAIIVIMIVCHDKPLPWKYHATPTSRGKRSALGTTKRVNFYLFFPDKSESWFLSFCS